MIAMIVMLIKHLVHIYLSTQIDTSLIVLILGIVGFFSKSILECFFEEIRLPVYGDITKNKSDLNFLFGKGSSDDGEAGPSSKKPRLDSPSKDSTSSSLFDGLDINRLDAATLRDCRAQLKSDLERVSSSEEDTSILEKKIKAIEEKLQEREADFIAPETESGVLTKEELINIINELASKREDTDPNSEEYISLLEQEGVYEDILADVMSRTSNRNSPDPGVGPSKGPGPSTAPGPSNNTDIPNTQSPSSPVSSVSDRPTYTREEKGKWKADDTNNNKNNDDKKD